MRKTLSFLLIYVTLLIFDCGNVDAVIDIFSRGHARTAEGFRRWDAREPSTPLSRSLAHYTMGIIYDNEGRFEDAARQYEKALEIEPDISYIHTRLAADYLFTKREIKAIEELKAAKSLDPQDLKPRFLLGLIYTSQGKFDDARNEYEDAVRANPESIWGLSSLADVLVLQEKMNEAAAIYEKLLEKEKESSPLHFNLAIIYIKTGRIEGAIEHLKAVLRLESDNKENRVLAVIHFYLGTLYESTKQGELAIKEFREAIRLDPNFPEAYNYLGYMFAEEGTNLDEAVSLIKKALEFEPNSGAYLDSIGWAYFKKGMYGDALTQLEKAVKLEPNDPVIREHFEKAREKIVH